MTPEEAAALAARADAAGYTTLSDFVRAQVLGGAWGARRTMSAERAEVIRGLTVVGERLSMLARLCAHNEALWAESEACLAALRETIARVAS
jgi:hypothetical protein